MKKVFVCTCTLLIFGGIGLSFAQDSLNSNNPLLTPETVDSPIVLPLSSLEFTLSLSVLGFGLVIIFLEIYLIKLRRISSEDIEAV